GWHGLYEVSNLGRIKRLPRIVRIGNGHATYPSTKYNCEYIRNYQRRGVRLQGRGVVQVFHNTAQIVLLAWVGKSPPGKPWALHLNDDHRDNRLSNLAWGSRKENMEHAMRNGHTRLGKCYE